MTAIADFVGGRLRPDDFDEIHIGKSEYGELRVDIRQGVLRLYIDGKMIDVWKTTMGLV